MDHTSPPSQDSVSDKAVQNITRAEELAYELRISEVMIRDIHRLTPEMSMAEVVELFQREHISGAPVLQGDELVGVLSLEDVIHCLTEGRLTAPASEYMTRKVITIKGSDPVIDALKIFVAIKFGRLPVVDENGKLIGILTKGDITRGLLSALQKDYQEEEIRRYRARHLFEDIISDRTSLILRYDIQAHDFNRGGAASSNIKRALLRLGANPQIARRCGIAIYEAEMNLIIHTTHGGVIRVEIEPHQISIIATDDGPGIADIEQARRPGYSTATDQIRELGFGAGMGLTNIERCVDEMNLESTLGKGTHLRMRIHLDREGAVGEGYAAKKE